MQPHPIFQLAKMGCTSSIPDSLKGSTVSTQLPPSEWRTNTLALLQRVFPEDQEPWLLELLKGIQVWEDSDFDFREERRYHGGQQRVAE
jgi:hypothetical protein